MLETRGLTRSFGALRVTKGIDLAVAPGERRVLLGPNGAGKTTLFNLLVGELRPDAGSIHLDGRDVTRLGVPQRARLGLSRSYQKNTLFDALTVGQNLGLAAAVQAGAARRLFSDSLRRAPVRRIVAEVAEQVRLTALLDAPVRTVSYGARRQLEVGIALATRPRVLLMDEPTSGVGPDMARGFLDLLRELPREMSLLVVAHDMDLAFAIADRISVLNNGAIVFEGTPEETRASELVREIYLGRRRHA